MPVRAIKIYLTGNRVNQDLRITSGLPFIRPESRPSVEITSYKPDLAFRNCATRKVHEWTTVPARTALLTDLHDNFANVNATRQHSSFTGKLEEKEYFIPTIYLLQGILISALPLLPSMDKPFSFTRDLWSPGVPWSENFFYLPMAAGLILIAASFLRNSERGASAMLAFQGTLAGLWFGIFTLFASVDTLGYRKSQESTSGILGTGAADAVLLALFFSPLIFTFFYAVKDLRQMETVTATLMRLMYSASP